MSNVCAGKFPVRCTLCARVTSILFNDTAVPNTVHLHCTFDNIDTVSETNAFMLSLGYNVNADPALWRPHNVSLGRVASTWHFTTGHSLRYGLPTHVI